MRLPLLVILTVFSVLRLGAPSSPVARTDDDYGDDYDVGRILVQLVDQVREDVREEREERIQVVGELTRKISQLENKNQQLETKNQQLETKTQQLENKNQQLENKNQQLETKTQQLKNKDRQLEAKTQQLENKTQQLETKTQQLENKNQQLETVVSKRNRRVAFEAKLHNNSTFKEGVIVYNSVITNIGGAYNPRNGVFTAPVDGVYFFSVTVFPNIQTFHNVAGTLVQNDVEKCTVYQDHLPGPCEVVLYLRLGDQVKVKTPRNTFMGIRPTFTAEHNFFSGFLL